MVSVLEVQAWLRVRRSSAFMEGFSSQTLFCCVMAPLRTPHIPTETGGVKRSETRPHWYTIWGEAKELNQQPLLCFCPALHTHHLSFCCPKNTETCVQILDRSIDRKTQATLSTNRYTFLSICAFLLCTVCVARDQHVMIAILYYSQTHRSLKSRFIWL